MMGICFLLSTDAIVVKKSKTKPKNAKKDEVDGNIKKREIM